MYNKKIILLFILICSSATTLFSEEIVLGGNEGWGLLYSMETEIGGLPGPAHLRLADSEYSADADTEMLLHFNDGITDAAGKYRIKKNTGVVLSNSVSEKGGGSAVFNGGITFLEMIPDDSAAFAAGSGRLDDFSIEFWLNPARLSEGETIIQWNGAAVVGETIQQEILCAISNRDLFWELKNIFLTPELGPSTFILKSSRSLIPKRWHHHMIRYDDETGLLEYLIDGIPEDIIHTSRSGGEEQELYSPYVGAAKAASFIIGRGFTGYIDELRISAAFEQPELNKYSMNSGTAITEIIDLGNYDSRFLRLNTESRTEGKTQIYYYYRISNRYFQPDAEFPGWNQFNAEETLPPGTTGRYLQIMCELFPDGTGVNSPQLAALGIEFTRNLPPVPPAYISGKAGSGSVVLNWQPVTDADIGGYKLYYGEKPGMYFGADAAAGSSPIDVGNINSFTINGLVNGKLYYFAVTSYDNAEIPHESTFSREISIRPSAIIRNE
ncbi:MAG: hypothetical protein PQJ61_04870 [Spirochaetales bacterium]|uniref:Fibronectin type-III domain-containing protein n=1 Tax=Candidatus Thalassospirochaeta sargassi TaxID=3119039 RepID=A0AAJ1IBE3_9SPIO|nr:hypothetical protein [Spirochaetales bacterium]